jgi:hypothetical protein
MQQAAYQCLFLKRYLQPIYLESKIVPNFDAIALLMANLLLTL